ncbi:MAG: tat pathway signal sequence [Rhodoferax sp.]|nr:tat pathway signal sequence [Rhodoferax sp.]
MGMGMGMGMGLGLTARSAPAAPIAGMLDREQSTRFRDWMTLLVHAQIDRGPTPRWTHRDCAGLVRFCVGEALRPHDVAWRGANGLLGRRLPPDLATEAAAPLRHAWRRADGSRDAYVGALELVQENTTFVSRQLTQAALGDMLFFDQGDEQHLMVWMGNYIAYHTGHVEPGDNGLRAVRAAQLLAWSDTRWRPSDANPNFAGVYRLAFLAQ